MVNLEAPIATQLRPSSSLGRYVLEEQIGEGAFATTYRARDTLLGRTVALKVLRASLASDSAYLTRFAREAQAAAAVDHPHVVQVYDYGEERGAYYLALQFIPGTTLKEVIHQKAPLHPAEAVDLTRQILRGLGAIHAAGIVHRDVKPQNVLIDREGLARLTDFGIAYDSSKASSLTTHGTTLGTPAYMAPEQASGGAITPATDLYAVGIVLFELLTGRLPFQADTPLAVMLAQLQRSPPSPSDWMPSVSAALNGVVLHALAKDPAHRFSSAQNMDQALADAVPAARREHGAPRHLVPSASRPIRAAPGSSSDSTTHVSEIVAGPPSTSVPWAAANTSGRPYRRPWSWAMPLIASLLVLLTASGLVAKTVWDGLDNGGTSPTPTQASLADAFAPTKTRATTAEQTERADDSVLVIVETPRSTRTPTPRPTATITPLVIVTRTPKPTRIPTVEPTETLVPEATDQDSTDGAPDEQSTDSDMPTIAPSNGEVNAAGDERVADVSLADEQTASSVGDSITLSFATADWQGGYHRDDAGFLGRPWTALYGASSGYNTASVRFNLDEVPDGVAHLTIVGLDDESAIDCPISIVVNGIEVFAAASPFPSWDGVGNGVNAPWTPIEFSFSVDLLQSGNNQIVVTNHVASANVGLPPYILLSDVTLSVE